MEFYIKIENIIIAFVIDNVHQRSDLRKFSSKMIKQCRHLDMVNVAKNHNHHKITCR